MGNSIPVHKVVTEESSDFSSRISPQKTDNGFDSFGPHAPMNVKLAWNKAAEQTGVNGLGIGKNGMMTHIPAALVVQAEQNHLTGSNDIFGNSVESAKNTAIRILNKLDNPIVPETNTKIRDLQEQERIFYKSFINNLNELGGSAYDLWKSLN